MRSASIPANLPSVRTMSAREFRTINTSRVPRSTDGHGRELLKDENVLHAVDHHRMIGRLGNIHQALEAQQILALQRGEIIQPTGERPPCQGIIDQEAERLDAMPVPARVMMMAMRGMPARRIAAFRVMLRRRGAIEPGDDVGRMCGRLEHAGAQDVRCISPGRRAPTCSLCGRIDRGKPGGKAINPRPIDEIGLGHQQAIGDARLLDGLSMVAQRRLLTIDGIDW